MTTRYNGMYYTLFPERVNHTEAEAACRTLGPGGRLAQLTTQATLTAVGDALLPTLPMQYTIQVAWVGAQGILDDTTAAILSGDQFVQQEQPSAAAKRTSPSAVAVAVSERMGHTPDAAEAAAAGGAVPTWQSGLHQEVNSSLFTHASEHYLQWRGSDKSFSQYVPETGKPVCVAALGVPPPSAVSPVAGQQGRAQPGLYLFTCRRPTAYICECECVGVGVWVWG